MLGSSKSLHLDLSNDEAALQILPPPIFSERAGWQNISLKHFQTSAWEIEEHSHPHHELLIYLSQAEVERNIDCQSKRETIDYGDTVIIPAGVSHKSLWSDKNEFIVLTLSPKLVEWYAWDFIDPERVELLPSFARKDALIHSLIVNLEAEIELGSDADSLYIGTLTSALYAHLLYQYANRKLPNRNCQKLSPVQLKQTIDYINENLSCKLTLSKIAAQINISQHHFCRLFKNSRNISPRQYIIRQRIKLAMQLLRRGTSVMETAKLCGFSSYNHFSKAFKQHLGVTPKTYQSYR